MPPRLRVGVVGVGQMGGAIAQRLLELGHEVAVADTDIDALKNYEQKRHFASAFIDFVAIKKVAILMCVVDAAQAHEVLHGQPNGDQNRHHGLVSRLKAGDTVLMCSTVSPSEVLALAEPLLALGVSVVDAPMSGGPLRARAGRMSLLVSGQPLVLAACQPLFDAIAGHVHVVGERLGDAASLKLVNNLLAATNLHAAAQALNLASRLGLDPHLAQTVFDHSSGHSWIGQDRMSRRLAKDDRVHAQMGLLAKDTRLGLAMCDGASLDASWAHASAKAFDGALQGGLGDQDDSHLLDWLARSGV